MSLTLRPGERVLLVGPSGSGKSTLLRALAGLLETVDAGELTGAVTVDGVAPGDRPGAVGLVLQEPGAGVVAASVGRDVAFGPENVRMPRADMAGAVASALAAVGLGDLPLDTPTSALSGGQTQRLALAGTLALDPSVVLLDEPTAMLDPASAQEVRDAVAALTSGEGRPGSVRAPRTGHGHPSPTLVVVEHVLGPWVDLVDRLVVLSSDGLVVADGPVRETLASERDRLLAMGIWVPGAGPPEPLPVDAALVAPRRAGRTASLAAAPFVVERTTRQVDGTARTRRVAVLADPLGGCAGHADRAGGAERVGQVDRAARPRRLPRAGRSGRRAGEPAPGPVDATAGCRMPCRMPCRPPRCRLPTWPGPWPGCRSGRARRSSPAPCSTRC